MRINQGITRRQFLRNAARSGALLGFGAGASTALRVGLVGASEPQSPWPDLAVVRGPVPRAVDEAVSLLGGMGRFVKKGDRVVLKPNMSFANPPAMATTTSPDVVRAVALMCREAGAERILVLDHTLHKAELCMERCGIEKACKGVEGTHVLALNDRAFYTEVDVAGGKALRRVDVMRDVLDADVLINLPTAKAHSSTGVSLGMKNLMGLVWDRGYFHSQVDLDMAIADLCLRIRPALTIMDATRVLTDGGPGGPGSVRVLDTVIAGTDPVAVDALTVGLTPWYGRVFAPGQVKHILNASRLGLGQIDTGKLRVERATLSGVEGGSR